jgi:hypothetical protein
VRLVVDISYGIGYLHLKKKHGYLGIMCADPAPQHEEFRYENLIQRIVQFSVCLESNKEL